MRSEEEYEQLEQKERSLTLEQVAILILLLQDLKSNFSDELVKFYHKYGKDGVITLNEARKYVSETNRKRRLAVLFLALTSSMDSTVSKINKKVSSLMDEILDEEISFFGVNISKDDFANVKWGADDLTWQNRLWNNRNKWLINIELDLKQGWVRGLNLEKVLEQLDKRFISMEKALKGLVGNEATAIGSLARKEIFKKLNIKKYKFYAREDEKRCDICGSLHGLVFTISQYEVGVTASPIHNHCRCWEVPIVD